MKIEQKQIKVSRKKEKLLITVLFLLLPCWAFAQFPVDYGPKLLSPTCEVVTPHIQWLKPNSQGPLNILFITHRAGMREIVELRQRMDIRDVVFCVADRNKFYTQSPSQPSTITRESMIADLEKKLQGKYDVIVLGNINWSCFPLSLRYQILRKVKNGTTLLGAINGIDKILKRATEKRTVKLPAFLFPDQGLPAFSRFRDFNSLLNSTLDGYQFGQGKIILLKGYNIPCAFQILTPVSAANPLERKNVEYDYYLAYICHLLLFAADKEPGIEIRGKNYLQRKRTDASGLEFTLLNKKEGAKEVTCLMKLRNGNNKIVSAENKKITLAPGDNKVTFGIGKVPAGSYFADLWVTEGEKVLNFGSSFLDISSDSTIADIDIKKDYRREEGVSGKITLENKTGNWEKFALKIIQKDTFGRITGQINLPLPDRRGAVKQEIPFSLPPTSPLAIIQYLEARLYQGKDILDEKEQAFSISNLYPKADLRYILWVGSSKEFSCGSYLAHYFASELYRAGFDTQFTFFSEEIPLANLYHIPYATRFYDVKADHYPHPNVPRRTKADHVRLPCLTDPAYLKQTRRHLTRLAERLKPFSTNAFLMGDECHFAGYGGQFELCFSPTCIAAFHTFLKNEYKTLEALNKEYESNYTSFNRIQPVTLEEVRKNPKLVPLWVDYRRHMENTWAGIFGFARDVTQKVIPEAKIGYSGSDRVINSFGAADFYKLSQVMGIISPYDGAFVTHATVDFMKPGSIMGLGWYGGYNSDRSEIFQRYVPWYRLFRGVNALWVFMGNAGETKSIIAPDFSFYKYFRTNLQEVQELKRGIGKLIISAKPDNDKIAVLYSPGSVHVSTLTKGFPPIQEVLNSLDTLLKDTGYQYQIISSTQLANGILKKEDFQLLILPFVQALSRKEAAEIAAFVTQGGAVAADLRPGVCDQHGKPYEKGILDEIFGIKQQPRRAQGQKGIVSINLPDRFSGSLPAAITDASLKLTAGEPKARIKGIPGIIINRYGNGTALLLNFSLAEYAANSDPSALQVTQSTNKNAPAFRTFAKALLSFIGIKEKITISPELSGLRAYRFKTGHLEYLGLLRELPEPLTSYATGKAKPLTHSAVEIKLNRKYHIYNVRKGEYSGYADRIKLPVEPGKAELLSLFPYQVQKLTITLGKDRIPQGKALAYQIVLSGTAPLPGLHILHLSVISPAGKEISYYSENLAVERGKIKGTIPFACNETLGKWKLKVKDAASGIAAEKTFIIDKKR
ncbi:MAG: beta-galactosidase [Victivallaceae bacterium]|nr:beta-galactosidase [Victivallaceae bacterium]